ncbi:MAG: hypothetical protein H7Y09_11280, partial [Chitinophagaceae bacterium]|nr:hypothetical protein [Anaerolineae bacterium]
MLTLSFLVFILNFTSIRAQDETIPWSPDPIEIFAPGVEVVSIEVLETSQQAEQTELEIVVDTQNRVVHTYDATTEERRSYAYPANVELASRFSPEVKDHRTIIFHTNYGAPKDDWLLNTDTGEFSRPELICSQYPAASGQGRWVIYDEPDSNAPGYLCHTETGERTPPLPNELNGNQPVIWKVDVYLTPSPNGEK